MYGVSRHGPFLYHQAFFDCARLAGDTAKGERCQTGQSHVFPHILPLLFLQSPADAHSFLCGWSYLSASPDLLLRSLVLVAEGGGTSVFYMSSYNFRAFVRCCHLAYHTELGLTAASCAPVFLSPCISRLGAQACILRKQDHGGGSIVARWRAVLRATRADTTTPTSPWQGNSESAG